MIFKIIENHAGCNADAYSYERKKQAELHSIIVCMLFHLCLKMILKNHKRTYLFHCIFASIARHCTRLTCNNIKKSGILNRSEL